MRAGGDLANDSYVIRVGLQAILELDRGRLEACVSKCPHLKSGREPTKERKQMTRDKMEALFGLRT
ncbi:hypothetical protein H1P_6410002 [Hyella patelloides LEGE 07179]|uniref:Uncharacterized protein n=2 Tax=Hyella TaxID=945733 RepID=A0A563W264_9CYAN|nr:hypothetical protein H1P_6410002 [Hyella patelloides LEGE 07179]